MRFDVINLFDTVYQIRSGSGSGVFGPQYRPRGAFFAGVSKKILMMRSWRQQLMENSLWLCSAQSQMRGPSGGN
jgi:hypothetical protein